jgi:hypothetical protein
MDVQAMDVQAKKIQPGDVPVKKKEDPLGKSQKGNALDQTLKDIQSMLDSGDYAGARSMGEKALTGHPGNAGLLDLIDGAKQGIAEAEVSKKVLDGIAAYKQGSYRETITIMNEVLKKDGENRQARQYIGQADREISRAQIVQLLDRQKKAEESKDMAGLLKDMGNVIVSEQRRESSTLLFNFYENIESRISNVSISFQDGRRAAVKFSNMLTAVYKKNGQKTVVSEGLKTWDLEKQGNSWKVVSLKK